MTTRKYADFVKALEKRYRCRYDRKQSVMDILIQNLDLLDMKSLLRKYDISYTFRQNDKKSSKSLMECLCNEAWNGDNDVVVETFLVSLRNTNQLHLEHIVRHACAISHVDTTVDFANRYVPSLLRAIFRDKSDLIDYLTKHINIEHGFLLGLTDLNVLNESQKQAIQTGKTVYDQIEFLFYVLEKRPDGDLEPFLRYLEKTHDFNNTAKRIRNAISCLEQKTIHVESTR